MILKCIKWNRDDLFALGAIAGGVFLLEQLVIAGVMLIARPDTTLVMGPIFLPMVAGLLCLVFCTVHTVQSFETMVRHSITRKNALLATVFTLAFETIFGFAAALLLARADALIAYGVWRTWDPELHVETFGAFPLWGVAAASLLVVMAGLAMGAAIQRFGRKAFWVLWGMWMAFALTIQAIDLDLLFESVWTIPVLAVFLLLADLWAVWSLLHASVKH